MADSLFLPDADRFLPTELARGPWSPDSLHGGPVAALLAREAARVAAQGPMLAARLTIELLRPVPLAPLSLSSRVLRPGRRVQLVEASIAAAGQDVARATVLRIRAADVPLPAEARDAAAGGRIAPPEGLPTMPAAARFASPMVAYHSHATEHRAACGSWTDPGPMTDWIRLLCPVVAGEAPSPLQRVAAAADFGNGVSAVLPFERYVFINPDLTIHLHRMPVDEWVCLEAVTYAGESGLGTAESALHDRRGRIGRSVQSLLIEAR